MEDKKQILEKAKIMLGTPMRSGECNGNFTGACINLFKLCNSYSIPIDYNFKLDNTLLPLVRNEIVQDFMEFDYTHLLMIDGDTDFDHLDILKLILLDKDVIGAPIAKKAFNWENIKKAIKNDKVDNIEDVPYFGYYPNFIPLQNSDGELVSLGNKNTCSVKFERGEPFRVSSVGTGLILIKRCVFKKMEEEYPELEYYKVVRDGIGPILKKEKMFSYFELTRKKDGAMMAEDVSFCYRVNEMGMETWIYPWAKTVHHGNCEFPLDFSKNI